MLNILEGFDIVAMGHNSADYLHALVEAKRIAFADRAAYLGDPEAVPADLLRTLISKSMRRFGGRRSMPRETTAGPRCRSQFRRSRPRRHDLSHRCRRQRQRRLADSIAVLGFRLRHRRRRHRHRAEQPRQLVQPHTRASSRNWPRKRPPHTLIPAFVMKDGAPFFSFGVMGGDHQAQGHTQVLINLIDFGMNVQEAGEAARVTHGPNGLQVESAVSQDIRNALTRRGHTVFEGVGGLGGYQGIRIDRATGVLMGGSDVRKDGLAIGY
jgi:gamma-glutamyltranspeptidase/glutathione hydrolase